MNRKQRRELIQSLREEELRMLLEEYLKEFIKIFPNWGKREE